MSCKVLTRTLTLLRKAKTMDSSADQSGSISDEASAKGAVPSASETLPAADVHSTETPAAEPPKAEADAVAPIVTRAEGTSEPTKSEAAQPETANSEASKDVSEPVKSETAKGSSELVRAEPKTGNEIASSSSRPGSALVAFVPAAERFESQRESSEAPRAATSSNRRKSRLVLYGSQVAALAFLLGCGYVVSGQMLQGNGSAKPEAAAKSEVTKTAALAAPAAASANAATPPSAETLERAERVELHHRTQELADEIRSLKTSLDQLRNSVAQAQGNEEIRSLKKGLDGVKSGLEASKTETNAAITQLTAKLDHMQHEQVTKLQQMLEKAERTEQRPNNASLTTASIAPQTPAASATKPQQSATPVASAPIGATDAQKKTSQSISNWVVRDVYDGIALVEGPGGAFEVMQGENVPGLGTVKSIERRGGSWVVVTNRGNVEYARD
jgi:hypothetical protein